MGEGAGVAIDELVVDGILAGRIRPGMRLVEQQLGGLFGVSRTRVREALTKSAVQLEGTDSNRNGIGARQKPRCGAGKKALQSHGIKSFVSGLEAASPFRPPRFPVSSHRAVRPAVRRR